MNIEQIIYSVLKSNAAVYAIVGDNITPIVRRQSASGAAITYQQIDDVVDHDVTGASGWREAHWQINCWASDYDNLITLAAAVEKALDCYMGANIDHVFLIDQGDMPSDESENESAVMYGKRMEFEFCYNQ